MLPLLLLQRRGRPLLLLLHLGLLRSDLKVGRARPVLVKRGVAGEVLPDVAQADDRARVRGEQL